MTENPWLLHKQWQRPLDDPNDPGGINALRDEIRRAAQLLHDRRHELAVIQRETMRRRGEAFDREIRAIIVAGGVPAALDELLKEVPDA